MHLPAFKISTPFLVPHKFLQHIRAAVLAVTGAAAEIRTGLGEEVVSTGSYTHFILGWRIETLVHLWPHAEASHQDSAMAQATQPFPQHSQQAQACWAIAEPSESLATSGYYPNHSCILTPGPQQMYLTGLSLSPPVCLPSGE